MLRSAVQSRKVQSLFSREGLFLGTGAHPAFLLPTLLLPGPPRSLNSFSSSPRCCAGRSSCTPLTPNLKPLLFCELPLRLWEKAQDGPGTCALRPCLGGCVLEPDAWVPILALVFTSSVTLDKLLPLLCLSLFICKVKTIPEATSKDFYEV